MKYFHFLPFGFNQNGAILLCIFLNSQEFMKMSQKFSPKNGKFFIIYFIAETIKLVPQIFWIDWVHWHNYSYSLYCILVLLFTYRT